MTIIDDLHKVFNLKKFTYNKKTINHTDINSFRISTKHLNDTNNKIRENIISAIINNKVPYDYFILNKWFILKKNISNYIRQLTTKEYSKIECINKAGRKHNYDLLIIIYYNDDTSEKFMIELKFNVSTIEQTPQFVSPMKPSQYLNNSFEEYYYDNYLHLLSNYSKLQMPSKEEYLKQIHSPKPKCMKAYQELYYKGCHGSSKFTNISEDINFYNLSKELSNKCIQSFIRNTELNINLLSIYLQNTQKNKIYMLYSKNKFILEKINVEEYTIINVSKNPLKYRYECISKTGKQINILLRWKNGNGIAFPAFQIS
jgi:hypothetical protein